MKLFGSAIEIEIPSTFIDISTIRQVPDNQEVFAETNSNACIIVEILELAPTSTNPAIFHFFELAKLNEAEANCTILESSELPCEIKNCTLGVAHGTQIVSKFNYQDPSKKYPEVINLYLACFRIDSYQTDITISLCLPAADSRMQRADFIKLIQSFQILDWGLFG